MHLRCYIDRVGSATCWRTDVGFLVSEVVPAWLLRPEKAWKWWRKEWQRPGMPPNRTKRAPPPPDPPALFCSCKLHPLLPSNFPILHPKPTIWWALNYQCLFSWVKALKLLLLAWKRGHPTVSTICWNTFTFSPSLFFLIPWGENLQTITLSPVTFQYKMCFLQTDILEPIQASNLALFHIIMFWAGRLPHNAVLYMKWNCLCFHLKFQCLVLKVLTWTH